MEGLAQVDETALLLSARAGVFRSASISEAALLEHADKYGLKVIRKVLREGQSEPIVKKRKRYDLEEFAIFVKYSGQSVVKRGCTLQTTISELKSQLALQTTLPEEGLWLSYAGRLLLDANSLEDYGIQRDSTIYAALATHLHYGSTCALPTSLQVMFLDGQAVTVKCKTGDTVGEIGIRAFCAQRGVDDDNPQRLRLVDMQDAIKLIYSGRSLCPRTPLAHYKFADGTVLHILPRLAVLQRCGIAI
jgi:hypothetical protein